MDITEIKSVMQRTNVKLSQKQREKIEGGGGGGEEEEEEAEEEGLLQMTFCNI